MSTISAPSSSADGTGTGPGRAAPAPLDEAAVAALLGDAPRLVPPFPHRRTEPWGFPKLLATYRRNIIATFSAADYRRDLIHARYLALHIFTLNAPALVQAAFLDGHAIFQAKTPQMRHALAPLLGDGLFVSDREVWASRRAAVAPIIHATRVRGFSPVMIETAEEWRAQWRRLGPGAAIDALAEMAELTAEIISRTIFGRRLGRAATGEIVAGFTEYQRHVDQVDLPSVLGLPDWFPRRQNRAARRALVRVHAVIDDIIDRFARGEGDAEAVIARLFEARDAEGRPLPRAAIRNEAIVIFMAGHETTANTLAWAWYLLSQDARARALLHAELDRVLGGRAPAFEDVRALAYTRAVIEETLRLYPPVPILGRQALAAGRIGGTHVPKGAIVMVSPFMLHRKPGLWPCPDLFLPERFLEEVAPRPGKFAYIPFATGPRICPGLVFGLTEAVICLAALAQDFAPVPEPGHRVEAVARLTLRPGERLPMRLHPRTA